MAKLKHEPGCKRKIVVSFAEQTWQGNGRLNMWLHRKRVEEKEKEKI